MADDDELSSDQSASLRAIIAQERVTVKWYTHLLTLQAPGPIAVRIRALIAIHGHRIEERMSEIDAHYYLARADAEAGIGRCDGALREARRPHSPLAPYIARYVAQRAAYALTAARVAAIIQRLEMRYGD